MRKLFYVLAIFLAPLLIACDDANEEEVEVEIEEEDGWTKERDEYRVERERDIERYETEVRDYDTTELDDEALAEWREFKADFNRRLENTRADLNRAGETTENEWEEFKSDVDEGVNSLEKDWQEFKAKLDDDDK